VLKNSPEQYKVIVDLVARVMSYMFIDQSPQEIDKMLDIQFEETRVYKDTFAKGNLSMVLKLLGQLSMELVREVTALPLDQLEALGVALLKFKKVKDLEKWLQENASATTGV
jgi:predicted transposase YdaD